MIQAVADLNPLRRELLSVGDARLRRVVRVVDALPERGAADALIAPLRPRLARLRPPRALSLTRLLFAPVESLIVPAAVWSPKSPAIPRPLLRVLGQDVRTALAAEADALQARVASATMADTALLAECGATLWPRAAELLRSRPAPADWSATTGLPDAAHPAIVRPLCVLLAEGSMLYRIATVPPAAAMADAEQLLRIAAADGAPALAMMLTLLLRRLPRAQRLIQLAEGAAAARGSDAGVVATQRALDYLLGDITAALPTDAALPHAEEGIRRAARLLEHLQAAANAAQRSARVAQVRAAREQLAEHCRDQFTAGAERLTAAPPNAAAEPEEVATLEDTARALRRLDVVGRRLSEAAPYERTLRATAARLLTNQRLAVTDRLRLAEILVGPEAALAMLPD
ncbi:MAG: hypothetical protein J0I21_12310 [Alphaproteobacteria bacterium]|nr:hypothetical protein [Alphaproteobacteria bacterium]